MTFAIHPLPYAPFAPLFAMDADALVRHRARRSIVTEHPGAPCRVSLADAEIGETVILANHVHLPERSPYRASHAIYVREDAREARPEPGEVPPVLTSRLLSLRGYDAEHLMQEAEAVEGTDVSTMLEAIVAVPGIAYVHVHYAKAGCFAARATRATRA